MKFHLVALSLFIFTGIQCSSTARTATNQPTILFYGSKRCGICRGFFRRMESDNIKYTFYDVDEDESNNRQMWALIHKVKPDRESIRYPVIRIDGKILVSPSYAEFKETLRKLSSN